MELPKSDTGIYVGAGIFTIVVFAVSMAAVSLWGIDISSGSVITLSIGFLGFMAVYFVSLAVYRGIERKERTE